MAQNYARRIEKDIFASFTSPAQSGSSEIIDLNGADKFSCQAVYDVLTYGNKTFDSGEPEIDTFTFQALADTDPGDYLVVYDTLGDAWAFAADTTGSDPEPTGAVWVSIPADHKAQVDISADTTADDVATTFADAINTLIPGITFQAVASTDDVACTQITVGVVSDASEVHNEDDSGAGSITVAVTNAGVASEVSVVDDTIAIPSHGYPTGLTVRLTTTGTLPFHLLTATNYYVIVIDADTIQLATSLQNALDGVPFVMEDQGSSGAVHTVTPQNIGSANVGFYKSNDAVNWVLIQAATNVAADGSVVLSQANVSYRYFKAIKTLGTGSYNLIGNVLVIGDSD